MTTQQEATTHNNTKWNTQQTKTKTHEHIRNNT